MAYKNTEFLFYFTQTHKKKTQIKNENVVPLYDESSKSLLESVYIVMINERGKERKREKEREGEEM